MKKQGIAFNQNVTMRLLYFVYFCVRPWSKISFTLVAVDQLACPIFVHMQLYYKPVVFSRKKDIP